MVLGMDQEVYRRVSGTQVAKDLSNITILTVRAVLLISYPYFDPKFLIM